MAMSDPAGGTVTGETPPRSAWTRIASALVLAPPVVAATALGAPFFEALVVLCAVILGYEWWRLSTLGAGGLGSLPLILALLGTLATTLLGQFQWLPMLFAGGAMMVIGLSLAMDRPALWPSAGVFYLGVPLAAFLWLRSDPAWGAWTVLWLLGVVWATDTGAYVAGRLIGGPRLAPRISPNKTWAGLIGGMICAGAVGLAADLTSDLGPTGLLTWLAMCLAVVAQGGDLFESYVKRRFRVKDSGSLIPGHGGLLDRVDGLLAAATALALMLVIMGGFDGWLTAN